MKNLLVMLLWDCFTEFFNSHLILHELRTQLNYTGESPRHSLKKRSLLVLSNSHVVTHEPQPFLENVIQVGGLHIKATKPLPADLQAFMDSSPQGYLLVLYRVFNGNSVAWNSMQLFEIVRNCSQNCAELCRIAWKLQGLQLCASKIHLRHWKP